MVVGIGVSNGGLAALKSFLERVPPDSGLVFVVVGDIPENWNGQLAEQLQPHSRLPIESVGQTTLLAPNRVYLIAPNANLRAVDTHLRWSRVEEQPRRSTPIDQFLRTLASTFDGHSVAVILSGAGSDGTLGVKDVKANGGMVIVQDPAEAESKESPQSAIATGLVDFVLPVAEIPDRILRIAQVKPRLPASAEAEDASEAESALLSRAFGQLRIRTGRDFSHYKRSTILRRIARRMQLNCVEDLATYVDGLQERPEEVRALADDLLITVTSFFRDPEVFDRLESVEIKRLFEGKGKDGSVRVWSVGCATGEEAYSLAMLLVEEADRRQEPPQIRVFASDLHGRSLEKAREGFYTGDIAADVSPERLQRFFRSENGGYRVRAELRDVVVFAPHNLLAHAPFSRMDLIACRNLLIYLEKETQQEVIELFHYALNPQGTLVLGSAESMQPTELFTTEDKKLCFFRRGDVAVREPRLPVFPQMRSRFQAREGASSETPAQAAEYADQHQRMVEKYVPPSILVGEQDQVLYISENVERYLQTATEATTQSAVEMVREELRAELQAALQHVRENREIYDSKPIPMCDDGHVTHVVLRMRPAPEDDADGLVLVVFDECEPLREAGEGAIAGAGAQQVDVLQEELRSVRQRLDAMSEEYESGRKEMLASSEEIRSTTEELRSTMEELETSRQELQSINFELQTANRQSRRKVDELDQLSSDLQNLLIATEIATLFLDRDLRILRFTPKLGDLFNVRVADRGRPISDLTHRLGYDDLRPDAKAVINRGIPVERELQDEAGRWYLTRIHPYRDNDDRIDGVVVTFVDITDRKDAERMRLDLQAKLQAAASEKALRKKESELARVARTLMVGELATSIAHEVNQPLAGVVTNAEAGLRWLTGETPNIEEARNSLSLIIRDGNRASSVIRRVREFVKKESSSATALNIGAIVRETTGLVQFDLEQKGIGLTLDIPDGLPLVNGDRIQLEQVILNLMINAIEAMAAVEGRASELLVRVRNSEEEGVLVSIRDTGIGIEPEQIDKMYDSFFTTKATGVGMGLSISRSIIEAHGGRIWAVRNDGPGLTVEFNLPVDGRTSR
ncbi:MAG: CheR family methyltransferase [Paludibaculum sp.]